MAYLGKTPSQATRARYYYTATGGETSLSGSDDNGNTLVFSDGNYVDVMLNGVTLVAGTDYNTTTANTIGGLTALTASDVVEVVVYDTFSVFGGNVNGDFNIQNGTLTAETVTASGLVTAQDGLVVDNDGATVVTFDRATSDGTIVDLQKDGSSVGSIGTGNGITADLILDPRSAFGSGISGAGLAILPMDHAQRADNHTDLGEAATRWKDLYLSGGVYLGGTGAANKLDDVETGTWNPTSYSGVAMSQSTGSYTKVGDLVFLNFRIVFGSEVSSSTAIIRLPFTARTEGVSNAHYASFSYCYTTYTASDLHAGVQSATDHLEFFNGSTGTIGYSAFSGKQINGSIVYHTAS